MDIYMVGGAVRDALLGLATADRDWVVVGSTPEDMVALGYLPVGRDFPVFLHPQTREEYALARTERNTARGYRGFAIHAAPDVTLEEDLARRDLTINSIAARAHPHRAGGQSGVDLSTLIDPYGGQADIRRKVLRHVTDAFREDPVRILRLARFAARFADFSVAPETLDLVRRMVVGGELEGLVAERVWQELARGLMENTPSRMFDVLRACGALQRLLPELKLGSDSNFVAAQSAAAAPEVWRANLESDPNLSTGVHLMRVLNMAARLNASLPVRFACLAMNLESDPNLIKGVCERLRVPTDCRELADVVAREHGNIHRSSELGAAALVRLLERCDAFRKPQRFADALLTCECDARGCLGLEESAYPQRERLAQALLTAQSVATDSVAQTAQAAGLSGPKIGEMIHAARVQAVQAGLLSGQPP
jgi:tRNA nucleotidyltransferase (CCA-adding enzyme)